MHWVCCMGDDGIPCNVTIESVDSVEPWHALHQHDQMGKSLQPVSYGLIKLVQNTYHKSFFLGGDG